MAGGEDPSMPKVKWKNPKGLSKIDLVKLNPFQKEQVPAPISYRSKLDISPLTNGYIDRHNCSFPKLGRPNGTLILSPGPEIQRQSKIIWESKNIWDVDLQETLY